ncbi:MAG: cell division protein FtsA [bacterium]
MFIRRNEINVLVALEVGTSKVVAAAAGLRADGSMMLLGVGEAPSSGVRKGEIVDFRDAQACVRQALHSAEKEADVEIKEVYLVLTGSHITSRTDVVRANIDNEDKQVTEADVEELKQLADRLVIPRDYVIVRSLLQHYCLDNQAISREPVGLSSQTLEAHYHLIYGLKTRLQTTVRCVREQDIDICGYAPASYAMAQSTLSSRAKQAGALAIDMGAGVTNYIVYLEGEAVHTGVIGVGGDHLTQDLAMGLRLPESKAEKLKKTHGDLFMDGHHRDEQIIMERDMTFEERVIYRDSMIKILNVRQRELLELIEQDIEFRGLWPRLAGGVFITGGASQIKGLHRLASEVFPVPVELVHEHTFDGGQTYNKRPDLSTVLGMLKCAHREELQKMRPSGWKHFHRSFMNLLASMRLF